MFQGFKSEDELGNQSGDTDREAENLVLVIEKLKNDFRIHWLKEESPMGEVLVWAKAESEKDLTKEGNQLREVDNLSRQWTAIQNKYGEIQQSIITVGIAQKSGSQCSFRSITEITRENTTINADLLTLLTQAKNSLQVQQPTIDACPVCDNSVENTVVKSLDEKIASMSYGAAAIAVEKAKKGLGC